MTPGALVLRPQPEGGWYRETWRAAGPVRTPYGERDTATAILFPSSPARSAAGEATLMGCLVAPGFDVADVGVES